MEKIWTERFPIRTFDTDAGQSLSPQAALRYLEETAGNHAHHLGFSVHQLLARGYTWVLSRLLLRLRRSLGWREELRVRTWPCGVHRLFALRDFLLTDGRGEAVGEAASAWLLLTLGDHRPVRIEPLFQEFLPYPGERAIPGALDKLPALEEGCSQAEPMREETFQKEFQVRYSDLDLNQHVNNVSYVEWLLESLSPLGDLPARASLSLLGDLSPLGDLPARASLSPGGDKPLQASHRLQELEIDFFAEAGYGERVRVVSRCVSRQPLTYLHSLRLEEGGREAARARTLWRSREAADKA